MKLEVSPIATEDAPAGPLAKRTQRHGRVVAVLDGDAHLHVWEPNRGADRLDIDLTRSLAVVIDIGLDAPPRRQPHWTDTDEHTTLLVSLDAGAAGTILIDGHAISEAAAVNLAADGFVQLIKNVAAPRASDDATDADAPQAEPEHDGPAESIANEPA